MKDEPDLFGGLQDKEDAQARALAAATVDWRARAMAEIERLARVGAPFTSEVVTAVVGLPRHAIRMNRNNAVGALMSAAAKRGIIHKTGRYVPSQRRRSHGAMLAEWRGK